MDDSTAILTLKVIMGGLGLTILFDPPRLKWLAKWGMTVVWAHAQGVTAYRKAFTKTLKPRKKKEATYGNHEEIRRDNPATHEHAIAAISRPNGVYPSRPSH